MARKKEQEKNNFLLSDEWESMFCELPDEKAGQLIKMAFRYHVGKDVECDDPVINAIFTMIRERIDRNDEEYKKTCERNREIALEREKKKREAKVVHERAQACTNVNESSPVVTDNDNDNEYDNDIDIKEKGVSKDTPKEKVTSMQDIIGKPKKKKPEKAVYGEYQNVKLTPEEYDKLMNEYGVEKGKGVIRFLDEYIEDKPSYKSKSHYLAIRRWVADAWDEKHHKQQTQEDKWADFLRGESYGA